MPLLGLGPPKRKVCEVGASLSGYSISHNYKQLIKNYPKYGLVLTEMGYQ